MGLMGQDGTGSRRRRVQVGSSGHHHHIRPESEILGHLGRTGPMTLAVGTSGASFSAGTRAASISTGSYRWWSGWRLSSARPRPWRPARPWPLR